ncbi:MAG: LytTR family DNA-binding domain-containing protein [Oscillospiraceae bacterium]
MRIALCDDEPEALAVLGQFLQTYCQANHLPAELDAFASGEELLRSPNIFQIAFLDICMAGMDGIAVAKALAARGNCLVVFTTSSPDYAISAYNVRAVHYLMKPLTQAGVDEAMGRCLSVQRDLPERVIMIKSNQTILPVTMASILYIEVCDKISTVHTDKGCLQTYTALDTLLAQLDSSFLRVQRSFIINMNFVESFLSDRVMLRDGTEIVLSRNNRGNLKKAYQQFLFDLARRNEP